MVGLGTHVGLMAKPVVFVTRRIPPDALDPLLRLPNAIVAPHIASATVATRNAMADIAADNLLLGLEGRPLRGWVNPEVASRWRALAT